MGTTEEVAASSFEKLAAVNVSENVEKKNGFSYLSWAWAWGVLMQHYPEATYSFDEPQVFPDQTQMVFCTVNIGECSRRMWLPVMDHRNKANHNPQPKRLPTVLLYPAWLRHGRPVPTSTE
jgi:hypothetical protein